MADKIPIMNYSIDVTELDYNSAKFTSMPGTNREKKFILVLDYIENRWDLWKGHQTDWVENALIGGRINHKSCIYKILPKALRFIDDLDHEKIAA